MTYLLLQGDARHIPLADESVDCVVTSPPYWGLRDYGVSGQLGLEPTPDEYVAHLVAVFREVWRVLRKDGTCWLNIGDSYAGSGKGQTATGCADPKQPKLNGMKLAVPDIPNGLKPKDLCMIPARVALALQADGVDIVQFDEPAFNVYMQDAADWGVRALEREISKICRKRRTWS